jgi:hypothetical protein
MDFYASHCDFPDRGICRRGNAIDGAGGQSSNCSTCTVATSPGTDGSQGQSLLAQAAVPAAPDTTPPDTTQPAPLAVSVPRYFANWFNRVEQAQASQPHWMSPLVTVTPVLVQQVRYDQYWENQGNGGAVDVFGAGKGLELIPTTTNEILINPPAYQERYNKRPASGWADDQFLVVKQRLLSANEQDGNYIVTAFLGVTAPTGTPAFSNRAWIVTPTIADGKGWGDFDIQATMGLPIPTAYAGTIGTSLATNLAFQYHVFSYFWPEFEINHTYWFDGLRGGKNQVFFTPGIILGRFQIHDRIRFVVGVGYQFSVAPPLVRQPALTPVYDRAWILTTRLTF